MRKLVSIGIVLAVTAAASAGEIVPENAEVEKVATGFDFTEGPVAVGGDILFTDIPNEEILRYDPAEDAVSVYRKNSGAANGLWWVPGGSGKKGHLVVCEGGGRRMTRVRDGKVVEVLASEYKGKRLNSPNDLAVLDDGTIYFTDPRYGDRSSMEMRVEGVYRISPDGELTRIIDYMKKPNGLIPSPDGSTLYIADNGAANIWEFRIEEDGSLTDGQIFAWMNEGPRSGGADGMTVDAQGNVYAAGSKDVWVWNSDGERLTLIPVPEGPSNCTFGGANNQTLYITARTSLYRIKLNVHGAE